MARKALKNLEGWLLAFTITVHTSFLSYYKMPRMLSVGAVIGTGRVRLRLR